MTGRGIDQILGHPSRPRLYESYVQDARIYVELAETVNGPIAKPVAYDYIWGDALTELDRLRPDVRIINLETSITRSDDPWPGKGIHYRMHPDNIACLTSAGIDCCVLANNHVLDWAFAGLTETLHTLHDAQIMTAGAGSDREAAVAPALLEVADKGRVVVLSMGMESSGIPWNWSATETRAGVNLMSDLSPGTVQEINKQLQALRRPYDIVVASIHWGGNWGYDISREQMHFAHRLIDEAGVDIVYGHSSHHPKGIEVHHGKPVIYGCGDFLNDYEGISGYESYRGDLALMYFADMEPLTGKLVDLTMIPMQMRRFRLNYVTEKDSVWMKNTLHRECQRLHTHVDMNADGLLALRW
jgi:poly-gamma-glutamate capsule biosynthesis protein CapA/YwtB (metallophosphatase superfamily)